MLAVRMSAVQRASRVTARVVREGSDFDGNLDTVVDPALYLRLYADLCEAYRISKFLPVLDPRERRPPKLSGRRDNSPSAARLVSCFRRN